MGRIDPQSWKEDLPAFAEKTAQFYAGELDKNAYKGFSGLYGSYAQKGGQASMLRLRMTAGRVTQEKLAFVARAIREYAVPRVHFTTGQTIQFHDLDQETVCAVMEQALDVGIVTMGGGGDFPRNVTCSPLAGLVPGERFDVLPWAQAAGEYLMHFVKAEKMPRKLKVAFAGSGENESHATYKDLGFVAREDGAFDVYSAGGLGNNPRFGVLVAEGVAPEKICYYIKAMWLTFRAYGNYENRGKARTRYMQEVCGGPEGYKKAYLEKLQEVLDSGEDLDLKLQPVPLGKKGNGTKASGPRVIRQKQEGLYAVAWHPIGGQADPETFCRVSDLLCAMEGAEMRLSPDETAYLVNLTGDQAETLLAATEEDTAHSRFETTVSCIGGATCQVGMRGLPGAAEGVCPGGAGGRPAGRGPAPDAHLRLQLLLRHPPDRRDGPAGRRQGGGRQGKARLYPVPGRRQPPGGGGHGPGAGFHRPGGRAQVPGGAGPGRGGKRPGLRRLVRGGPPAGGGDCEGLFVRTGRG